MDHFNWDDLRFFLSVARAGRLTTAARRLGADHATVSRRITALEKALQAKLFERSPQGYALTAQGERLLERADALRRPQRFHQLLQACDCDFHGRLGWQDRPVPGRDLFPSALEAAQSVDAATIAHACERKEDIPGRVHAARVEAVAARLGRRE